MRLSVFDFDGTLAITDSYIYVRSAKGVEKKLTPTQYGEYTLKPSDTVDFRDFTKVLRPRKVHKMVDRFEKALRNNECDVVILTARGAESKRFIRAYIDKHHPNSEYEIITLGGHMEPKMKSNEIKRLLTRKDYTELYYAEDRTQDVQDVIQMLKDGYVSWVVEHVVHHPSNLLVPIIVQKYSKKKNLAKW